MKKRQDEVLFSKELIADATAFGEVNKTWIAGLKPRLTVLDDWPESADEIIDTFARELADRFPAEADD